MQYSDVNAGVSYQVPYPLVYDETAINDSIQTCIKTHTRTRPFRRVFGSTLRSILFEPIDNITALRVKQNCKEVIEQWETRVMIKTLEVLPDYDNQSYYVELVYVIPALNNKEVTYSFGLSRY